MDLTTLSNEELQRNLRALEQRKDDTGLCSESEREAESERQAHRHELEIQNRALRELQRALEAAVQRYHDLYDNLPIGYLTLTKEGRIVQANLTAAGWLRRARTRLAGTHLSWFLNAFDAGRVAAHLETCLATGGEQRLEDVTLRTENGLQLTVQIASRPILAEGGGERFVHTALFNISRVRQAQALVGDIAREEEALSESILRDLHAPVATISSFSRLILSSHADSLVPDVKDMVERMECAAVRMEATLQHLLEYSCLGSEEIALDPVNLDELVQQIIVEQRRLIRHRAANITVERPLPCVRGARLMLAQVIANVLAHALKSGSPEHGPSIVIAAETREDVVVLRIRDAGLQRDVPEQSFRVFERLIDRGGCLAEGIGLAIVRRAIERMNGRVWVESPTAQGSSFNLELPKV